MKLDFTDKVNIRNCKYVYTLNLKEFKSTFWSKAEMKSWNDMMIDSVGCMDIKVYFELVKKYCLLCIEAGENSEEDFVLIPQTYKFTGDTEHGRIYVDGFGIQSLQNKIRKFLTGDYLVDIDIKNAHPTILYKLVLQYNEAHPDNTLTYMYLKQYVKHREKNMEEYDFNKFDLLIALNSDTIESNKKNKGFYTKNSFLTGFHIEKMKIFKALLKSDFYKKYKIVSDNDKNPISSRINKLFCIIENELIQSQIKHKVVVPMFDGFMIEKERKSEYDHLLEEDINELIKWDYKDNTVDIDISDFDEETCRNYSVVKKLFEESNLRILNPFIFVKRVVNEDGLEEDAFYKHTEFMKLNTSVKYHDINSLNQNFIMEWDMDEQKREYNGVVFNPYSNKELDKTPITHYNLFKPFVSKRIENATKPVWFLDFLKENIANGKEDSFNWLLKYVAQLFQRPDDNIKLILVLRGESGIGKDTFIEILEKLMGKLNNYVHRTAKVSDIFGDGFNSDLKNKLVLQLNEMEGIDGIKAKEQIKDQATAEFNNIKEKYIPNMKQKNNTRIIVSSNNNSPVQYSFDERRFVMFKCSSKNKQKTDYWSEIYENMNNQDILDNLYTYLLNIDISSWRPFDDRPQTEEHKKAIINALPVYIKYMKEIIDTNITESNDSDDGYDSDGDDRDIYIKTKTGNLLVQPKSLYTDYSKWAVDNYLLTEGQFKSKSFKVQLEELPGITFNKSVKIEGVSRKYVYIEVNKLIPKLNEYEDTIDDTTVDIDDL
tara:strand:- start:1214 stop:3520 length:2307 start_codon:yes stop_codon:yes gene_type:complete